MNDDGLLETLEWLVDIPSVTRDEQRIADLMEERLAGNARYRLQRWRHGILASPSQSEPRFLLVGHLDTVPPSPQQTRRRHDGRL